MRIELPRDRGVVFGLIERANNCDHWTALHPGGTCWVDMPPWASDYNSPPGPVYTNGHVSAGQARDLARRLYRDTLVTAIESAGNQPSALAACNVFVGAIGKALGVPYFDGSVPLANEIYDYFSRLVTPASGGAAPDPKSWRYVGSGWSMDPQAYADRGFFVFGCAHSSPGHEHGHAAIVAPSFLAQDPTPVHPGEDPHAPGSQGPWIRDAHLGGDRHVLNVRASNCFGHSVGTPIWVAYVGDGFSL